MYKGSFGILLTVLGITGLFISNWMVKESGLDHPLWTYIPPYIVSVAILIAGVLFLVSFYNKSSKHKHI